MTVTGKRIFTKPLSVIAVLILCISVFLSLTSCEEPREDLSNGEKITFTDALGRLVSVDKAPKRVAALLGSFADVWMLSGGELCAAAEDAWEDFGLDIPNAVNLGGAHSPSLELLLSASPDFVIASASTASNIEMREPLEAMGITVAYFDVDCFEDYLEMLKICTDITYRPDLYQSNGLLLKTKIDSLKAQYASSDIPDSERKILLLRASASSVKAKGSQGTILGEMLADMGCINIADDNDSLLESLSIEAIIKNEPYRIFAVTMGNDTEAAKSALQNMINENPAWSSLDAIRQERLYVMEKELFNLKPNGRWDTAYEKLYEKLTEK